MRLKLTRLALGALVLLTAAIGLAVIRVALTPAGPAQIAIDREAHNWGRVVPDSEVSTTFILRNKGREALRLGEPTTSCGCTKPTLSDSVIESGEHAWLQVGFRVPSELGPVRHTVIIPTNDPGRPKLLVNLHAHAWRGVQAEPQAVQLGSMRPGQVVERMIQLQAPDGGPFRIGRVSSDSPNIEARAEQPEAALPVHRVHVTYRPDGPLGFVRCSVRVVTDRPDAAWIDLPVGGEVVGRVRLSSDALRIELDDVGRDIRRTLFLRSQAPDPAPAIASITVTPPWQLVAHSERLMGGQMNQLTLTVRFPEGEAPRVGMIDLALSAPEPATYRIPISARGGDAPLPDAPEQATGEE